MTKIALNNKANHLSPADRKNLKAEKKGMSTINGS